MAITAEAVLERWQHRSDCLIEMMHDIQTEHNYLPREILTTLSGDLQIPLARILEVASFYNAFSLKPKGRCRIGVCMGTACYVKGGPLLLERFETELGIKLGQTTPDGMFGIEAPACVGTCGQAPVIIVNGEEIIGRLTLASVSRILKQLRGKMSPQGRGGNGDGSSPE